MEMIYRASYLEDDEVRTTIASLETRLEIALAKNEELEKRSAQLKEKTKKLREKAKRVKTSKGYTLESQSIAIDMMYHVIRDFCEEVEQDG